MFSDIAFSSSALCAHCYAGPRMMCSGDLFAGGVCILGGSWVVISGVTSPLIWVISIVTLLITPLITTHEPPSTGLRTCTALFLASPDLQKLCTPKLACTPPTPTSLEASRRTDWMMENVALAGTSLQGPRDHCRKRENTIPKRSTWVVL